MSQDNLSEKQGTSPDEDIAGRKNAEHSLQQRVKELRCLYAITSLIGRRGATIEDIMQGVVDLVPASLQYPDDTCARIDMNGQSFMCERCGRETPVTTQSRDIVADGKAVGKLTVGYLPELPPAHEGPFLKEECELLDAVAMHLGTAVQHKKALQQIEMLARFPDQNPNPVLRVSGNGAVLYHNKAGTSLLEHWGTDRGEPLPAEWRRLVTDALADGKPRTAELGYADRTISLTFAPVIESVFVNVYGLDVTEREAAEMVERELRERLARAERMDSLGVLAGGIAHDLNNLLGPNVALPPIILEDLDGVTREQCENIDEVRECVAAISESSSRAAETIKDMSVLSRSHVQTTTPLHLNQAITEYLKSHEFEELTRSAPHVSFKADLDKSDPWISGSRSHVDRLLSNLTRNAVLAIEDGGAVAIKTWSINVKDPVVAYEVIEPGSYVVLEINDTGTGIEPDALERVFEPFFTTRKKSRHAGSGLGLSVVHGIVRSHGGAIDVKSKVQDGTTFMLYLPAVEEPSGQDSAEMETVPTGTESILVVDDEPNQLFIARRGLEGCGYGVTTVASGQEALTLFEQAKRENRESPFDLVVLDMVMKPGAGGTATHRAILELYPEQKAMIVSGYAGDEGAEKEAQELNASWLAKPYHRDDLARAVRKRLDTNP
ncbi:MAG: response regulator [Lentisphaerae bacterium]|nr:response regulator [Lentisphaerota bacterium]